MLIAITANGEELNSPLEGKFERCQDFIFYDTGAREIVDVIDNPELEIADGGGQEAGQLIISRDVEAILTEDIDPEAGDILAAGGVQVYLCHDGSVASAIARFLAGDLELRPHSARGIYPGPGSPETPHSHPAPPGSDPGREEADEEVVGAEVQCVCPVCGETVTPDPGVTECDTLRCPQCNSLMVRMYQSE